MLKKILLVALALFLLAQLVRPERNVHPGGQPRSLAVLYPPPAPVGAILARACYDCHSNNSRYPALTRVQPVAGWYQQQVDEGLEHLNFDEFRNYPPRRQAGLLDRCIDQVRRGEMPPAGYLRLHGDARLTPQEQETFMLWAAALRNRILQATLPADSSVDRR